MTFNPHRNLRQPETFPKAFIGLPIEKSDELSAGQYLGIDRFGAVVVSGFLSTGHLHNGGELPVKIRAAPDVVKKLKAFIASHKQDQN